MVRRKLRVVCLVIPNLRETCAASRTHAQAVATRAILDRYTTPMVRNAAGDLEVVKAAEA